MGRSVLVALALVVTVGVPAVVLVRVLRSRRHFGTAVQNATFDTLHTAARAAAMLRPGLTRDNAARASTHLRSLLGSAAVALTDRTTTLAWDGAAHDHAATAFVVATDTLATGRTVVVRDGVACNDMNCPLQVAVVAPLRVGDQITGTLAAYGADASTTLVRATTEVAHWLSAQLELAELDRSRARAAEAELRALRAQISPHFVYNSLSAIASFVRTDPDRARELLLEFAEFTRYSFRRHGEFTTLAEELRSVDRYLLLEHARFGDRLQITLRVAPEVLPVAVPFLCLQPLVENAVRHGLESKPGVGHVTITAQDAGGEAIVSIEDDGVGMEPEKLRAVLRGDGGESVGLGNVDERLRSVFGPEYGLVVETGVDAGTRVTVRLPKFRRGVRAS